MLDLTTIWIKIKQLPLIGDYAGYWVGTVLVLFVLYTAWHILRKSRPQKGSDGRPVTDEAVARMQDVYHQPISRLKIAHFFIKIFKIQVGATHDAVSRIIPVEDMSQPSGQTYEIKVALNNQWEKRRMTVARTGEESASRSRCYHVIYDRHLVFKVPHRPIKDFNQYLRHILADHKIVKKLHPRECIVPTVSTIAEMIRPAAAREQLSPVELEEKNIKWLLNYPAFQEYIKIDNYFVFVMDLSKYYFLGQILNDFHDLENRQYREIVGYPAVIWENHGFEGRYGFGNDTVLEGVKNIYAVYEKSIQRFLKSNGQQKILDQFTLRKWFLIHLAGRQLTAEEKDLPPDLIAPLNEMIRDLFERYKAAVGNYRATIRECIQRVSVEQNKRQMGGMITNLLDLLAWLRAKKVAMRDLKPDNLLVAGDRSRYPDFLNDPQSYTIGLIDVETAVDYSEPDVAALTQPLLGGTPSYATPSHLCLNLSLDRFFVDFRRILYLQDWYAAVAMIYKIVIGEVLFDQTAKLLIGFKNQLLNPNLEPDALFDNFKTVSRSFWYAAASEFSGKMTDKKDLLKTVRVEMPDCVKDMLKHEIQTEKRILEQRLKVYLKAQTALADTRQFVSLMSASREDIEKLKKKWQRRRRENGGAVAGLKVLSIIEKTKLQAQKHQHLLAAFEEKKLVSSAYQIMELMFNIVQQGMYNREWGELNPIAASLSKTADAVNEVTIEATV